MAKLVYTDQGIHHEFVLELDRDAYSIGRNPMCDLRVNNPSMSRKHAEIRTNGEGFVIADLDSSNGTFVNGRRIDTSPLANGDVVLCGEFRFTFTGEAPRRLTDSMATDGAAGGPPPIPRTEEVSAVSPPSRGNQPVATARGIAPSGVEPEDAAPSFGDPIVQRDVVHPPEPRQHTQQAIVPTRAPESEPIDLLEVPDAPEPTHHNQPRDDGELEATISALRHENGVLRDEIEQRDREIDAMRADLAASADADEAWEKVAELNARIDDASHRHDALTIRLQEAEAGIMRRDGKLAEQEIRIEAAEAARAEAAARADALQASVDKLSSQKQMMTEAFDDLRNELRRLLEVNEALTAELERARGDD